MPSNSHSSHKKSVNCSLHLCLVWIVLCLFKLNVMEISLNSLIPFSSSTKTLSDVKTLTRKIQFAIGHLGVNERSSFPFPGHTHVSHWWDIQDTFVTSKLWPNTPQDSVRSSDIKASRSLREEYHTNVHLLSPVGGSLLLRQVQI